MIAKSMGWVRRLAALCVLMAPTTAVLGAEAEAPAAEDPRLYFDRMARFLASAQHLRTTISISYDVVQESGQTIEFGERHRLAIVRPDRLRADILKSDGERGMVLFDGERITAYSATHAVYAQADRPGSLDQALVYFLQDLEMRLPLALMFNSAFPKEMAQRLEALEFVEVSSVTATPSVHLAGRTDQVDFQVWIPQSGDPLPQRMVITYRHEQGQPQFRADFRDWRLTPETAASDFAFTPPVGAERIPFLVEIHNALPDDTRAGESR